MNAGWIFKLCQRWVGSYSLAQDLTQEVFIRVFLNLHSYRGEAGEFRTWLGRVARNLLIDDYRRNRKERCTVSYDNADGCMKNVFCSIPSKEFDPEASTVNRERLAALRASFRLLGRGLRIVVILRDVHGFSYEEISNLLKIPVGTVKSRVSRGRIELARLMRQRAALCPAIGRNDSAVA